MTPQEALDCIAALADESRSIVRTADLRAILSDIQTEPCRRHHYTVEPSGRGVGFDWECTRCGRIENKRPMI